MSCRRCARRRRPPAGRARRSRCRRTGRRSTGRGRFRGRSSRRRPTSGSAPPAEPSRDSGDGSGPVFSTAAVVAHLQGQWELGDQVAAGCAVVQRCLEALVVDGDLDPHGVLRDGGSRGGRACWLGAVMPVAALIGVVAGGVLEELVPGPHATRDKPAVAAIRAVVARWMTGMVSPRAWEVGAHGGVGSPPPRRLPTVRSGR